MNARTVKLNGRTTLPEVPLTAPLSPSADPGWRARREAADGYNRAVADEHLTSAQLTIITERIRSAYGDAIHAEAVIVARLAVRRMLPTVRLRWGAAGLIVGTLLATAMLRGGQAWLLVLAYGAICVGAGGMLGAAVKRGAR